MNARNNSWEFEAKSQPAATDGGGILGQVTTVGLTNPVQFPPQRSLLWYGANDENIAVVREVRK